MPRFEPLPNRPVWDDGRAAPLPSLTGEIDADVCVIGLGGSGLACIGALADSGTRVVGIDAAHVAAGAAGRNGGFLLAGIAKFHHDIVSRLGRRPATEIYRATLAEIDRMIDETPDAIRRTGTLRIATSPDEREDCAAQLAAMRSDGLPVEPYDGPEGRGLRFPYDAAFDPVARCRVLASRALARGVPLFEQSPAKSIDSGTVETPGGIVHARHIVVAVDGGLECILPELASRVRTARLQMLATAPLDDMRFGMPVYARYGLDYWQQRPDRSLVLGGCRDVGGDDEWTTNAEPTTIVQSALSTLLREQLRVDAPVTHRWASTVAFTQTGFPVIEQVRSGVWAIGGYSGTGNVVGRMAGRAVAELIVRGESSIAQMLRG